MGEGFRKFFYLDADWLREEAVFQTTLEQLWVGPGQKQEKKKNPSCEKASL